MLASSMARSLISKIDTSPLDGACAAFRFLAGHTLALRTFLEEM